MRTQSPDTSPEAERILLERIRQASVSRRFRLVQSLSQRMLSLSTHSSPQESQSEILRTITTNYGQRIGQRVQAALAADPAWQEQPIDLTKTVVPVIEALRNIGISSYIGGSLASSIHGMQQSASDIDLVLIIGQRQDASALRTALTILHDQYVIDSEELAQGVCAGVSLSLLHRATFMKIDLLLPQPSAFNEAMQAHVVPLPIDDRYAPLPLASALEMVVWKLARCAKDLQNRSDGLINDAEWNDVLGMLKVQGSSLDIEQLKYWAQMLGAGDLLAVALDDAGLLSHENHLHLRAG